MSRNIISSFWQSPLWSEILTTTGQAEVFTYTRDDLNLFMERRTLVGPFTGVYILGPDVHRITEAHIHHIRSLAKKYDLFIQIEPIDAYTPHTGLPVIKNTQKRAPFRRFIEPTTAVLLLENATEASIFQKFKEKCRYNIRLAERRGLTTLWVRGDDISRHTLSTHTVGSPQTYTEIFFQLLRETTDRDGFAHNSLAYYQHFLRTLEKYNAGGLLLAVRGDTVHAAGIFVYWDHHAIYYYGASSSDPDIRRDKGPHLLQWHAIQEALRRKCLDYDFLGISSRDGDKLTGVTRFKMQFNPETISLPPEHIIVLRPGILSILRGVKMMRRLFR